MTTLLAMIISGKYRLELEGTYFFTFIIDLAVIAAVLAMFGG